MRKSQLITTPAQNSSREMILYPMRCVRYLIAPISPGLPILPSHYESRATSHESRITSRLKPRNPAPKVKMYEGLRMNLSANCAKRTQFPKQPKSTQTLFPQRITKIQPLRRHPKTNPNEPKRTQSKPNFWLINAPQSQNEPKRTQLVAAKPACHGEVSYEAGWRSRNEPKTNPIFGPSGAPKAKTNPNEPNLSRRSLPAAAKSSTKPGWRSRNEPNFES